MDSTGYSYEKKNTYTDNSGDNIFSQQTGENETRSANIAVQFYMVSKVLI